MAPSAPKINTSPNIHAHIQTAVSGCEVIKKFLSNETWGQKYFKVAGGAAALW